MRICLVCTEKLPLPPLRGGAIQIYIDGVLPYLRRGHTLTVVCRTDPLLPDRERRDSVRYVRLPAGEGPEAYRDGVAQFLAHHPFDLVVVFNRPAFVPALAAAAPSTPFILSMHNDMFGPDRLAPTVARAVLDRVSAVITISDYVGSGIAQLYPHAVPKLRTIRSGVDTSAFLPAWADPDRREHVRRRLGLVGREVVLHVSRLSAKKGNHIALQAMRLVRPLRPEAVLLVVGSRWYGANDADAYTSDLFRQALTLGEGVCFTGFVPPDRLPEYYLAGDLFLCASQWQEPLARVHYEAMAAGLPIITTDRGGNAEVIIPGVNGLIARPHDEPRAFAAHILDLLGDPQRRAAMGVNGRELALERYTWERVAGELEEVYRCAVL